MGFQNKRKFQWLYQQIYIISQMAKGFHDFHQQPGSDYNGTFSLVIIPVYQNSADLGLIRHWPLKQIDIKL